LWVLAVAVARLSVLVVAVALKSLRRVSLFRLWLMGHTRLRLRLAVLVRLAGEVAPHRIQVLPVLLPLQPRKVVVAVAITVPPAVRVVVHLAVAVTQAGRLQGRTQTWVVLAHLTLSGCVALVVVVVPLRLVVQA